MLADDSLYGAAVPCESALQSADERVRIRLALTRALQASLCASRKALLELNLAGIERGTSEQIELSRELAEDLRRGIGWPARERRSGEDRAPGFAVCVPQLAEELRQSEREVLQAARLQAALLARSQGKLRVLSNMLAGSSCNYGPLLARSGALAHARKFKRGGEI